MQKSESINSIVAAYHRLFHIHLVVFMVLTMPNIIYMRCTYNI